MSASREVAAQIPGIVEKIIDRIEIAGHDDKWSRLDIACLKTVKFKATADNAVDIRCWSSHRMTRAQIPSMVFDETLIPGDDPNGLPSGYIEEITDGHYRLSWPER